MYSTHSTQLPEGSYVLANTDWVAKHGIARFTVPVPHAYPSEPCVNSTVGIQGWLPWSSTGTQQKAYMQLGLYDLLLHSTATCCVPYASGCGVTTPASAWCFKLSY